MPRFPKVYPLDFNISGSATIRLFGRVAEASIHYVNAKLPVHRMICPNSITESDDCPICKSNGPFQVNRRLAYGWDCNAKRWAFYLAPIEAFIQIFSECKKVGVTEAMTDVGHGPDIFIQKLGMKTEIAIASETVGKERGPGNCPPAEIVFECISKQSIWKEFNSVDDVEREFPKDSSPDK